MPVAGWYVDPDSATNWRYWDGGRWTDYVSPMHPPPRQRVPYSFSAWFEESTAAVKATVRRVGVAVLVVTLAVHALFVVLFVAALDSDDGTALRRLLDIDDRIGSSGNIELTDAEWDRAGDLLADLARTWLPVLGVVIALAGIVTLLLVTLAARVSWAFVAGDEPNRPSIVQPPSIVAASFRRLPAVLASMVLIVVISGAAAALPLLPFAIAVAGDSGGSAIGITATLGFLAAFVVAALLFGRLSVAVAIAARGGHGLGISRSWTLTGGHYWGVIGRLLVAGLIASAFAVPFNFLNGAASAFGLAAWISLLFIGQAITSAASVLVTTPAQVVLAAHLTAQHESSRPTDLRRSDGSPFVSPG